MVDASGGLALAQNSPGPASRRRKCILVLGMHRSGTSALSGLLATLGAQRPKRELPPQADNPRGFFEPSEVVAIHDRFLSELGSYWHDWRKLPDDWQQRSCTADALNQLEAAVRHDFEGDGTFLVKDPRICRFVELWTVLAARLQADLVAAHIFRTPVEVASSLRVRNGFDEALTRLLWLRHVLEAEAATRRLPRAFLSYEGLIEDSAGELDRALRFVDLGIQADAQVRAAAGAFVDPTMKRQRVGANGRSDALGRWVKSAYSTLQRLREAPDNGPALKALDRLRSQFDSGCEEFGPMFAAASGHAHALSQEVHRLRSVEEERTVLVNSLRTVSWAADRIPALEAEVAAAQSRLADVVAEAGRATELDGALALERQARSNVEAIAARVPDLEQQVATVRSQLEAMEAAAQRSAATLAEVVALRDRIATDLAARDVDLAAKRSELSTKNEELSELATDRKRLEAELAASAAIAERVPALEQALSDAKAQTDVLARQLGSRKELVRRFFTVEA